MNRFKFALQGIDALLRKDFHFAVHLLIAFIVAAAGFLFRLDTVEWLFIISAIFIVLISEILNTSIEYTVDLVTGEVHTLAKCAKDTSALAVLLAAIYASITGMIIFIPKIIGFFA
ncbi:diacylglycerol kinase family protein [Lacicoccus alkaliphilus]|uniref:Diacylglycerol kinase (ATP) n=1 Tax=Lacicoccus alkaliphilus DSM 16010 TaxID=1123231 RepID=A0A1M7BLD4_9BACL|nr:diacylglycerol kinase family protein [Salinicoccus alkaliphilus]SHL55781.1 diacylglycerol kinase (ATP) [Salinicoccus alkaliphilus DSM 16010]